MSNADKTSANTLLLSAARAGHLKQIAEALRKGAEIDKPDADKETALMAAARQGHVETVRFLIENGSNPNRSVVGDSALRNAIAIAKSLPVVKALVEGGANPNIKFCGDSMIAVAAQAGDLPIIKWLIEKGVDPHAFDKDSGTGALDKARWYKQKAVFNWLKEFGVVSPREPLQNLSRALVKEFGGKSTEHTRGFSVDSKFAGHKAQFNVDLEYPNVNVFNVKFQDTELRGIAEGNLIFAPKQPESRFGRATPIKGVGENIGLKAWRAGESPSASDQFVDGFFQKHKLTLLALKLSGEENMRVGHNLISVSWSGFDIATVLEKLRVFSELMAAIARQPKPDRQLFDREWILKPAPQSSESAPHNFGGNLDTPVACTFCGDRTNLMAQIDLADSALPKTAIGKKKLPLFWCLSCLEWDPSYYDISGNIPMPLDAKGKPIAAKKNLNQNEDDLPSRAAILVPVPAGKKAGRKSKIGGKPNWIQPDSTPDCPKCDSPMAFAAQLDSDKHIAYSDMGLLYAFACPECKILATLIQSH